MITVIVRSGMQISPGHSRSMIGAMGYRSRLIRSGGVRDESVQISISYNLSFEGSVTINMKQYFVFFLIVGVLIVISGCIDTATPKINTIVPVTGSPTNYSANSEKTVAYDTNLLGTWYLDDIELNRPSNGGGNAPGFLWNTHYTLTFDNQGTISGFSGCNNFTGHYTLTGENMTFGRKGIVIGPLSSTQKDCSDISGDETVYLNVLQNASLYETFDLSPYPGHDMPTLNLINKNNFIYYGRTTENWTSG